MVCTYNGTELSLSDSILKQTLTKIIQSYDFSINGVPSSLDTCPKVLSNCVVETEGYVFTLSENDSVSLPIKQVNQGGQGTSTLPKNVGFDDKLVVTSALCVLVLIGLTFIFSFTLR